MPQPFLVYHPRHLNHRSDQRMQGLATKSLGSPAQQTLFKIVCLGFVSFMMSQKQQAISSYHAGLQHNGTGEVYLGQFIALIRSEKHPCLVWQAGILQQFTPQISARMGWVKSRLGAGNSTQGNRSHHLLYPRVCISSKLH